MTAKSIAKGLCSQKQFDYQGLIELLEVLPASVFCRLDRLVSEEL